MYTKEELLEKQNLAEKLKLQQRELLYNKSLTDKCNGIGANWMWSNLRDMLSVFNPTLVLAADIHDCAYELGGTEEDREIADNAFLSNALKLANHKYGWYNPLRYRVRKQAFKFYSLLRVFGKFAFNYKETTDE
jgi:hypothetical protein